MNFSDETLQLRKRFLTADFARRLSGYNIGGDPFTLRDTDFPKAFRVGECRETAPDKTEFQVLLFWKDDVRSEQREIKVAAAKQNNRWLIDDVSAAGTK